MEGTLESGWIQHASMLAYFVVLIQSSIHYTPTIERPVGKHPNIELPHGVMKIIKCKLGLALQAIWF